MIHQHNFTTKFWVRGAFVAALYAVLAMAFPMFSYGYIQFRLSEALVLLPLFFPEAIPGLALGCFIANLGSPFGLIDVVCGTLCTLMAAFLTYRWRDKPIFAAAAPILINGLGVSAYVAYFSQELYWLTALSITLSETVVIAAVAAPLTYMLVQRTSFFTRS